MNMEIKKRKKRRKIIGYYHNEAVYDEKKPKKSIRELANGSNGKRNLATKGNKEKQP